MTESVEISSHCNCTTWDGDPADDCWGCFDDAQENLHHLIVNWLGENNAPSGTSVLIEGKHMTWLNRTGHITTTANTILDELKLERADYRILFNLDGNKLTAKRWSHDEPMGASFTFTITKEK